MTEVKGYTPLTEEKKAGMNKLKVLEERCLRALEEAQAAGADGRCVAIAKTELQTAFMWANRGIAQPQRIELPEEVEAKRAATNFTT